MAEDGGGRWMMSECCIDLQLPEQTVEVKHFKVYQTVSVKLRIKLNQFIKFFFNSFIESKSCKTPLLFLHNLLTLHALSRQSIFVNFVYSL